MKAYTARLRERIASPAARPWYIGAAIGLIWQALLVYYVVIAPTPIVQKVLGLLLLALLYVAFLFAGPLLWSESTRTKLLFIGGYWLVSLLLFPLIGPEAIWVWLLVVAMAGFFDIPVSLSVGIVAAVVAAQLAIAASVGFIDGTPFAVPVTALTGASMLITGVLSRSSRNLRVAHDEIARLAVVEERARFSRDLHDVLGHYLTVVTVKSNLARRLVRLDPDQAESEITDIEELSRRALADLRSAVANYRELTIETELAAASTALAAAGITATLPSDPDAVDPHLRSVFAWVLREGVTNVIRHSGASGCWVTIDRDRLTVADNGRGPASAGAVAVGQADALGLETAVAATAPAPAPDGNGLRGLRERVSAVGAVLLTGRSQYGGFELTARKAS